MEVQNNDCTIRMVKQTWSSQHPLLVNISASFVPTYNVVSLP